MEPINFIKTISPRQQHTFRRWYYISWTATIICASTMIIMQAVQCWQLYTTHTQVTTRAQNRAAYDTGLQQQDTLRTKIHALEQNIQTISSIKKRLPHTIQLLQAVRHSAPNTGQIQTCTVTDTTFTATINCANPRAAQAQLQALSNTKLFNKLKLVALNQRSTMYIATITGSIRE